MLRQAIAHGLGEALSSFASPEKLNSRVVYFVSAGADGEGIYSIRLSDGATAFVAPPKAVQVALFEGAGAAQSI